MPPKKLKAADTRRMNSLNHQYSLRRARPLMVINFFRQVTTASTGSIIGRA